MLLPAAADDGPARAKANAGDSTGSVETKISTAATAIATAAANTKGFKCSPLKRGAAAVEATAPKTKLSPTLTRTASSANCRLSHQNDSGVSEPSNINSVC
jgi:hypothetical protein